MTERGHFTAQTLALGSALTGLALFTSPLSAQEVDEDDEAEFVLDLTLPGTLPVQGSYNECDAQTDAARIAGEIVVCRSLGEASDGSWNAQDFERSYAERTQGPKAPDVDGSGIQLPSEGSVITMTVTAELGEASQAPVTVDFDTLPGPPSGSDADRIARGLPPLKDD
ncbi:MAG: hypothetical protein ABJK59_09275 [Erythrobacter sp.]|uniref:hypothetical protein n=1 Tax=Erythrobacter sp. TaxID=1042 RepID=UPI003296962F